jgi:hypothetical protein
VKDLKYVDIIRLFASLRMTECRLETFYESISSVQNKRLLPPYLIRGRNDNLNDNETFFVIARNDSDVAISILKPFLMVESPT